MSVDIVSSSEHVNQEVLQTRVTGTAKVKTQFLDTTHKRKLAVEFLGDSERQQLEENDHVVADKKIKLKGRNVNRPHVKRQKQTEKFCPSIMADKVCSYGEKCCFLHDIATFLNNKPPDIGEHCYVFETFGKCSKGITCRFSKGHLSDEGKNIVNEKLFDTNSKPVVKNYLAKDVQIMLRKKTYFKKAFNHQRIPESLNNNVSSDFSAVEKSLGVVTDEDIIRIRPEEKKKVVFTNKSYLAPLTTVGNLPFRRICKSLGVDITCGEMAMCPNILQGHQSEWALLKRHFSEDVFGIQICATAPDLMTKCAKLLNNTVEVDFVDINLGCPIDLVYNKGNGCAMMKRTGKLEQAVKGVISSLNVPVTIKMRTGISEDKPLAHDLIPLLKEWDISMMTIHGRSREQRYTKIADWNYLDECSKIADPIPFFGNGDVLSFEDFNTHKKATSVSGIMIARGALIKPWIFTELKEQRHWDISSNERLDILKKYINYGLEHWGSDSQGVETTRRFLLEWLSFLHRYIPVGILENPPQRINERPPYYIGRNELETLMASGNCSDWIKISEMLLGPVPDSFTFLPKHKANAYQ